MTRRASMRPGPHGPGNDENFVIYDDETGEASMRPGPHGPGNRLLGCLMAQQEAEASMRPGPHGPGNSRRYGQQLPNRECFNEAGAARPRKFACLYVVILTSILLQ